jgi:hypothetical protein
MSRQSRGGHLLHAGDRNHGASNAAEFEGASGGTTLEHLNESADEAVAILDEFSITVKGDGLEEKTEARLDEDLIAVEAEREAQLALIEELHNLDDVLACIPNGDNRRRTLVAKVGNENRSVDE